MISLMLDGYIFTTSRFNSKTENSKEKTNAQGFFFRSDGVPKDVASFSHLILI